MAIFDVFRGALSSTRKRFIDTFNRANQSGLGTASDGSLWNIVRGSWSISSNAAVGADTNYPMATVNMPFSDVQIDVVTTSEGAAAALWVTDANNWWAVGITQEPENCNCTYFYTTTYSYVFSNNCVGQNSGNWNVSNCNAFAGGNCNGFLSACTGGWNTSNCNNFAFNTANKTTRCSGSWNTSNCRGWSSGCSGGFNATFCSGNWNGSNQNAGNYFFFNCAVLTSSTSGPFESCSTCYPQYIRVIKSVAGTVSLLTQTSLGATLAAAFRVKTSGSQITASAYSDASQVTQIGSDLVYTPTGVTITAQHGITIIPSSYNQGYAIDSVEIKKN